MLSLAYRLTRPALFRLDAERAHHLGMRTLRGLHAAGGVADRMTRACRERDAQQAKELLGLTFPNPVGLAAGFDKDAAALRAWPALGFGFVEVGTVTPRPQPGNPTPRLFRLAEDRSLQNAMGFNNSGLENMRRQLERHYPISVPLGVNLGKNKDTSQESAVEDYLALVSGLRGLCDYFVVNVSSPNTPGLRDLQTALAMNNLFKQIIPKTDAPVLLKVAPDGDVGAIVETCEAAVEAGASGIIATNTTTDYSLSPNAKDFGGISGALLRDRSFVVFQAIAGALAGKAALISVGGIDSPDEARRRLDAGADLVQIYTGLVYNGPNFVKEIVAGLG